ncbi:MAG TPA: 3-hydroxyacyl-[acyl-carrier-protein] dehydratase FabZ [Deltaproteobacteria bacterium]|nr:MAG: 3-hydroxyacyl-[acyl-carrier-protein] dehydratase FabZ [Deltaproteobacteria bacterium GWA2_55_82]OGQ64286.1 MAG: 3-hydroxyacyl-[acyl-carrier-protein] dehydratase FabZ [Deltaproteobacteria bacterium RIFCSPLOWO2_02_FULL_55_12]OIJ75090.1 MAG: 3-hydroxyacyl-[acyl-carrier-protein] dehydratase FabZ [Deltaproteobacteria bacterium GWC2_55_46]HBG46591.1 3-hydroxyacyl-[acyl-carrier-protein] dehydratase FabZ [Deltaproteobacteria bacterium]HCY09993.1 3-hydroxyacyl-[acyl-carrier-protein] dehydratase 
MIDTREIMNILPHRYPFLLIDRILELDPGKSARGLKNVTINEPFFTGHFPGHPIMPGVLIIEAMAQVGGVLAFKSADVSNKVVYFMGIDKARFRKPVVPGDTIEFALNVTKCRGTIWAFKGEAFVAGALVAEAELLATIMEK